jgi:hypothetical protein
MAVAVGNSVITESEIVQQIRIVAFQNEEQPVINSETKRRAAEKLIEQTLIRREIEANRYTAIETPNVEPMLQAIRKRFSSENDYKKALVDYHISEQELRSQLQWQATLIPFIDVRFRPGIQIPEADIREYYDKKFLPEWASGKTEGPPSYEESHETIEKLLASSLADHALDRWLGQARTEVRIRYYDEAFQ